MTASTTHLVLLPTYNTGPRLREVVAEVLRHWQPGAGGGRRQHRRQRAARCSNWRGPSRRSTVLVLPRNSGKGAAVLAGALVAQGRGFTHALVMDADGQHPAGSIAEFMAASLRHPAALSWAGRSFRQHPGRAAARPEAQHRARAP